MRQFVMVMMASLLAGCATIGDGKIGDFDLRGVLRADVAQALVMANAAKDEGAPYRARCYETLLKSLPESTPIAPTPDVKGVVSGFELAMENAAKLKARSSRGLISEAVQADCGYIVDEMKRFVLRAGFKLAPVPGAGAAGGFLLR